MPQYVNDRPAPHLNPLPHKNGERRQDPIRMGRGEDKAASSTPLSAQLGALVYLLKHTITCASTVAGFSIFFVGAMTGVVVAQSPDPLYRASAYSLYVHPDGWDRDGYFPLGVLFPRDNDELVSYGFDFSEEAAGPMIDPGGNLSMGWFVTRHDRPIPPPANNNLLGQFEASWSWHLMPIGDDTPGYGTFTQARSWYDPVVQKFMLTSDAALARIYGTSPRPVMMWSLDNEWEGDLEYTPQAQAGFKTWLENTYGTIAAVNASWGTSYSGWTDIEPPKSEAKISNGASWLDWHSFQDSAYTHFTADRYRAMYLADPLHRAIAQKTTQQSFDLQSVGKDRVLDPAMLCDLTRPYGGWYGVDIYDADDSYIYQVNFAAQCIRPITGPGAGHLFLTETNNHGGPGWQFSNSIWRSLGNGAKAYDFFCFGMPGATGDSDEYGLTSPNTLLRDKAPYAVRFAYNVRRTEKFWARSKPAAGVHRIAILLDRQDMLMDDNIPGNIWAGPADNRESVYAALRQAGYWVDAIPYTKLDAKYLKQYDALLLVNSDHLDAGECGQIGEYLKGGGVLVADTQAGLYNEHHGVAHGLDAVLGVPVQAPSAGILTDTLPALSVHSYGHGTSIYSPTGLGTLHGDTDEKVRAWLANTLSSAHVLPAYSVAGGGTASLRIEQPFTDGDNIAVVMANVSKEGARASVIRMQLPPGKWTHAVWSPAENEDLVPVKAQPLPNGQYQYGLPSIVTAGVLYLFDDHAPLISVHDVNTIKRGIDGYLPVLTPGVPTKIVVSVYNSSSAPLPPGMLTARVLRGWSVKSGRVRTGKIPPYASYQASFFVTPPDSGVLPYAERMYPINLHWSDGKSDRAVTTTPVGVEIAESKCPWLLTENATYPADFPRKLDTHATYRYLIEGDASKTQVSDPASGKDSPNTALQDGYSRWLVGDESAHIAAPGLGTVPIEFDLKDVYPLHEVRLQSSDFGGYPTKMDVSVSDDGKTFKNAGSAVPEGGPGSGKWLDLSALEGKSGRYIRLNVSLQGGVGYIDEVEIWGYPKSH